MNDETPASFLGGQEMTMIKESKIKTFEASKRRQEKCQEKKKKNAGSLQFRAYFFRVLVCPQQGDESLYWGHVAVDAKDLLRYLLHPGVEGLLTFGYVTEKDKLKSVAVVFRRRTVRKTTCPCIDDSFLVAIHRIAPRSRKQHMQRIRVNLGSREQRPLRGRSRA